MVFTLLVAADIYGTKINYEIDFTELPQIASLRARVESIFGTEAAQRRPAGAPPNPFQAYRMQTFDDNVELWVDLVSASQLQDYSQVYIFQRESPWHREVQSKIPPPVRPAQSISAPPPLPVQVAPPGPLPPGPMPPGPMPPVPYPTNVSPRRRDPSPVPISASPRPVHGLGAPPVVYSAPVLSGTPVPLPVRVEEPPRHTTHDDKVRSVFDDLDQRRSGSAGLEAFTNAFERLRIEIGSSKVHDLFQKADVNQDGVLSYQEFERWAELYPTLIDSLFYRNRDFWLDKRQKDSIDQAQRRLDSLREREAEARQATADAAAATAAQEAKVRAQQTEVELAQEREREALAQLEAATQDTARSREGVAGRASQLSQAREEERQGAQQQAEANSQLQSASARVRIQKDETERAQARLREIERLLEEQRREVDRVRNLEIEAETNQSQAESRMREAEANVGALGQKTRFAADELSRAEQDLAATQDREREQGVAHVQARDATARANGKKDAEARALNVSKDREAGKRALETDASRVVETHANQLRQLEQENREHNDKRRRTEDEERDLLNQEVRIREQRDNLEKEEAMLRDSHRTFHSHTGRADQPPPPRTVAGGVPSRSPYAASPQRSVALPPPPGDFRAPDVSPSRYPNY
eukprot:Hpha_TRINITY_DN15902_c0_g5::TRINITY_DN15902_c0_g5_i1::g.71136::m.71136